jgi:hypothetical protein
LSLAGLVLGISPLAAQRIILYEHANFRGERLVVDGPVANLDDEDFNDRASSARIEEGDWELCGDARFRGCRTIEEWEVANLSDYNLNDRVSSLRPSGYDGGGGSGGGHQPSITGSASGNGIWLGSDGVSILSSVEVDLGGRGAFTLDINGEVAVQVEGRWTHESEGLANLAVTAVGGDRASGAGYVTFNGGRVDRVVIDGSGWRISFTRGNGGGRVNGDIVVCESNGGFMFCPVDPQGAVKIERRLGGSNCTYNSSWSWTRDGIWVDNGCRAEFRIGGGGGGGGRPRVR